MNKTLKLKKSFTSVKYLNLTGFSLIETLIACAILIIVCGALLSLSLIISNNIFFTRQRSVATNLAQDYLEKIRQIRDTNLIDSNSATNWNSLVCDRSKTPVIQVPTISDDIHFYFYSVSSEIYSYCYDSSSEPRLSLVPSSSGEIINVSGIDFVRKITFLPSGVDPKLLDGTRDITGDNSIKAKVEVSWTQNGKDQKIEVIELLTNWKQNL
ncbi:MAG: hypothetical protein Athens101428_324 [Candidatus Berkelbacteria bacterium Athens1014_28]|uniref:Uncharacterized protein n=1 Tax=Candidatus Berkelbacteria bacterium Athens1014_28 TaxID=2017145 RepID=A0A554LNB6_9BACT|nr:MAG: hypothetical protein Athens101428_324 [Candidatus Berkelbacteria bacterium Athens1014_28]